MTTDLQDRTMPICGDDFELTEKQNEIQCIISTKPLSLLPSFKPGQAQNPKPWDYADGVDTIGWLLGL